DAGASRRVIPAAHDEQSPQARGPGKIRHPRRRAHSPDRRPQSGEPPLPADQARQARSSLRRIPRGTRGLRARERGDGRCRIFAPMTPDLAIVLALLAAAVTMFALGRPRGDVVGLLMLVALPASGV